ncbi:hypothetical protein ACFLYE_02020 [Chloroflexota bacterium]
MKTRIVISVLIIGIIAVYCILGLDYTRQQRAQEKIAFDASNVAQELAKTPLPPQDLEQKLVAAQASLDAAQGEFPGKPNSTEIIDSIFRLAERYQVKAIPLATQQWSSDTGDKGYQVFRLNFIVSGDFSQVVDFISKLESGDISTLVIDNVNIGIQETTGEETVSDLAEPVTASLDVAIYAKSTDAD